MSENSLLARIACVIGTGEPDDCECWPINWLSFQVFKHMETQWNIGPKRVVGLKYESIPWVLQAGGVDQKEHARILRDLRVMEQEALLIFNRN